MIFLSYLEFIAFDGICVLQIWLKLYNHHCHRCRDVALSRCRDVALARCRDVALARCRDVALARCRDVALARCRQRDIATTRDGTNKPPYISIPETLIGNSRSSQNKTSIRGASSGISYKLPEKRRHRREKMEYWYSGTKNVWYGNWSRHVCYKWKCEVNRPLPLSTWINQDKRQKYCSLSCLWSEIRQNTDGPGIFHTLGCLP